MNKLFLFTSPSSCSLDANKAANPFLEAMTSVSSPGGWYTCVITPRFDITKENLHVKVKKHSLD